MYAQISFLSVFKIPTHSLICTALKKSLKIDFLKPLYLSHSHYKSRFIFCPIST